MGVSKRVSEMLANTLILETQLGTLLSCALPMKREKREEETKKRREDKKKWNRQITPSQREEKDFRRKHSLI
jgi:hypothetical protein